MLSHNFLAQIGRIFRFVLFAGALGFYASHGAAQTAEPSAPSANEYRIGPGDTLQVFVWRQPELTVTVPVRPDGHISTPLIEDVEAVGRTATELAGEIKTKLAVYVRNPEVNVIIQSFAGTLGQVRVIGQVAMPRAIPFRDRMTLMDAIIEVGGLTDFAAGNRTKVVRNSPKGKSQTIKVHVNDLMKKGEIKNNIPLQPGDIVIVPESVF